MAISNSEIGKVPQGGFLTRLKELNLSPVDLLQNESQSIKLKSLSSEQLSELREYRAQMLSDMDKVQGDWPFPYPPPPPPGPNPSPNPSPTPGPTREPLDILKTQDQEAYIAYTKLKPEEQTAFLELCRQVGMEQPTGLGGMLGGLAGLGLGGAQAGTGNGQLAAPEPQINADLLALLKSGALDKKDSQGQSLLQNLTNLSQQEMAPNLDRKTVFRELCSQIAEPGRIHQGTQGTCAPTTIEYLQATKDPAEYARLMVGLSSQSGEVTMRNGEVLKRDLGSLATDNTGRSNISRLYQSAIMEYANGDEEYDNRTDLHTRLDDTTYSGQYNENSEKALEALFGKDYQSTDVDRTTPAGRTRTEEMLRAALAAGDQVPVALMWGDLATSNSAHMLLVVGMTESTVVLRNPWGGNDSSTGANGPPRQGLDNGGTIEMSREEFFSRCYNIVLPSAEGKASGAKPKGTNKS